MDILLCGDTNIIPGIELVVTSAYLNSQVCEFKWHFISCPIDKNEIHYDSLLIKQDYITNFIKYFDKNAQANFYDCTELFKQYIEPSVNYHMFPPQIGFRLFVDKLLPSDIDWCLYIDCDFFINFDLQFLPTYQTWETKSILGVPFFDRFMPSVMGINLKLLRKTNKFEKVRQSYLHTRYETLPDEFALNANIDINDWSQLDSSWYPCQDPKQITTSKFFHFVSGLQKPYRQFEPNIRLHDQALHEEVFYSKYDILKPYYKTILQVRSSL